MSQNKQNQSNPRKIEEILNKVKNYILMEYGEELYSKINRPKYLNICTGYVKNCMTLNSNKYTIPLMANNLVKFIRSTV